MRLIGINMVSLAFIASVFPGLSYEGGLKTLFFAGASLTVINLCLQPIIKLLLLPINLLTLGMFRWLTDVLCLFTLTLFLPEVRIKSFTMEGLASGGFSVPTFHFSLLLSLITLSFLISCTTIFINWLIRKAN